MEAVLCWCRSKLGQAKRHILTDKNGIPLSVVIAPASTHDIKLVTDVIDNSVIKRTFVSGKSKKGMKQKSEYNHLCLDRAYQSKLIENEIVKRGYVPHIPYKRKKGHMKEETANQRRYSLSKNKQWVVEREQTLDGIIDSESCLFDTKRKLRTTLD
jgi:IS5 family transposase